ncbi:hypothetical protein SELMODRAFT_407694 [Selaginella moellendorffii]|uniref:RING-type domain-containing protein n=1 Tax=Selaginella moellendorffii TaxID=88036 RepID=D8R6G5_SELML|nr:hypothetical protein SELMODRAFT_407694 [Selaginella moellendorffii]
MGTKRVDIADWLESQKKDYAPSSLDRYLSQPESPTSPRWDSLAPSQQQQTPPGSSSMSSASSSPNPSFSANSTPRGAGGSCLPLPSPLSIQYAKGEMVAVRCNRHKWLLGEVRRLSTRGVRVWVREAGLLVNVPKQLLATHLHKMATSMDQQGFIHYSLPPGDANASILAAEAMESSPSGAPRFLVQCVRPAHLSHRQLFLAPQGSPAATTAAGANACAICGHDVIVEDEAVAPWDCNHSCHIDCIQDKPRFFSTMNCPVCAEQSTSPSTASSSPATPPPYPAQFGLDGPHHVEPRESTAESPPPQPLKTIDEDTPELRTPKPSLKPAIKKQSVSFSSDMQSPQASSSSSSIATSKKSGVGSSSSSAAPAPSTASTATSLAERMRRFSIGGGGAQASNEQQQQQGEWLTVIRDGQDTRQTASQQRIEHMARAKENTFSAKAKQQQQQQQQQLRIQ